MDDFLSAIVATLIVSILIAGAIFGAFFGAMKIEELSCKSKANALGYKYEWGRWMGCVLEKPDGQKILLEKLRYNELD